MKRQRLGASIVQETYLDKKTRQRKSCATWTVRYDAASDGPRKQRKVGGFATYDDAALWWLEQKSNPHRDVPVAEVIKAPPPTLREFSRRWLKSIKTSVTDGALATYEKHVRCWIEPTLGDSLLVDLERQPELIAEAQVKWLTHRRRDGRKGCVTPGYVKSIRNTLTTILNRAKRLRIITTNPIEFVDHVRVPRAEMRSLDPAAASQYLAVFDGTDLGCAVAVAIGSGCRRGELLALRWCDINLDEGTLRVARSLERVTIKTTKRVRYRNCVLKNRRPGNLVEPLRCPLSCSNAYATIDSNRQSGSCRRELGARALRRSSLRTMGCPTIRTPSALLLRASLQTTDCPRFACMIYGTRSLRCCWQAALILRPSLRRWVTAPLA